MSNASAFAEWLRRHGHKVYQSASSYWYDAAPFVLQAFPYGWLIEPSEAELNELMNRANALAVRYSAPLRYPHGMLSYHVVLEPPYSLEMLRSQARNAVKRGLEHCNIQEIPFERAACEGWALQRDTLERQHRTRSMSHAEWECLCLSARDLPGFQAWGATVAGELAALLLTCRIDDVFYVPYAASHHKFLNLHVNNALFYQVTCNLLATDGIKSIFFSLHSLDAPKSVNEFKFRMGFQARAVRQCVVFHRLVRLFVNHHSCTLITWLAKYFPESVLLPKTRGMMTYYLNGKIPLEQQTWPEEVDEKWRKITL
ncbi:MAG: hypothetical protein RMJ85_14250 [Anaerolineales bacterium]|nr:hypothetical protein [Anaerolineales bacterium]